MPGIYWQLILRLLENKRSNKIPSQRKKWRSSANLRFNENHLKENNARCE